MAFKSQVQALVTETIQERLPEMEETEVQDLANDITERLTDIVDIYPDEDDKVQEDDEQDEETAEPDSPEEE